MYIVEPHKYVDFSVRIITIIIIKKNYLRLIIISSILILIIGLQDMIVILSIERWVNH